MSKQEGSGEFFAGFLFGAFVGAALALLFAPAPGEELREQIREKSIELKDRAGELGLDTAKLAELREKGEDFFQQQKSRLEQAIAEGKEAAARKKEELLAQLESATSEEPPIDLSEQDA